MGCGAAVAAIQSTFQTECAFVVAHEYEQWS